MQVEKELRSTKEKVGSSRIFRSLSSTNRIGDIERIHHLRSSLPKATSVDFDALKYGRRGSLDYDADPSYHEMRTLLETAAGQKHLSLYLSLSSTPPLLKKSSLISMHCWLDCLAYTEIKSPQYRCTKAIEIYNFYVQKFSPMFVEVSEHLDLFFSLYVSPFSRSLSLSLSLFLSLSLPVPPFLFLSFFSPLLYAFSFQFPFLTLDTSLPPFPSCQISCFLFLSSKFLATTARRSLITCTSSSTTSRAL